MSRRHITNEFKLMSDQSLMYHNNLFQMYAMDIPGLNKHNNNLNAIRLMLS